MRILRIPTFPKNNLLAQAAERTIRQKTECITADLIEQAAASGTYKYPLTVQELEPA